MLEEFVHAVRELKTSVEGIWAAGDACSVRTDAQGPHWFQMRLWTQVELLCKVSFPAH